jgi:hypothetical protein
MCCFFILTWMIGPRLLLFLIWFLSNWTNAAFQTRIWPFLGFLFLPFATLFYLLAMHYGGNFFSGWTIFWTLLGLAFDLGILGAAKHAKW